MHKNKVTFLHQITKGKFLGIRCYEILHISNHIFAPHNHIVFNAVDGYVVNNCAGQLCGVDCCIGKSCRQNCRKSCGQHCGVDSIAVRTALLCGQHWWMQLRTMADRSRVGGKAASWSSCLEAASSQQGRLLSRLLYHTTTATTTLYKAPHHHHYHHTSAFTTLHISNCP